METPQNIPQPTLSGHEAITFLYTHIHKEIANGKSHSPAIRKECHQELRQLVTSCGEFTVGARQGPEFLLTFDRGFSTETLAVPSSLSLKLALLFPSLFPFLENF